MKTNEELLKFYGVELNKRYIITEKSDMAHANVDVGEKFKIENLCNKELLMHFEEREFYCYLHTLNGFSYKPCPEEVLDEVEKNFLANVIKPYQKYRRRINIIKRKSSDGKWEWIDVIKYCGDIVFPALTFPAFPTGKMYKGMKVHKEYTLEELGL